MRDEIFEAIRKGDARRVRALIEQDPSLTHVTDDEHNRPLHYAAARGHVEIAEILLDAGADIDGENVDWEWRPIVHAAWCDRVDMVKLLIERGADVTRYGSQPIHYAGQQGHREICRILVEAGAIDDLAGGEDPDAIAAFRAMFSYDADALATLLARRPELAHIRDVEGATLMHEAGTNGAVEVITVLIAAGADVNAEEEQDGATPIQRAALHNQMEACEVLREAGAEFSFVLACRLGWTDAAGEMLRRDPTLAHAQHDGVPIIDAVCEAGFVDLGRMLVEAGAEVDIFTACSLGLEGHVRHMLDEDPSRVAVKRGLYAYEPLHCAAECGHPGIVEMLLEAGADINGRNGWNFTPLHMAIIAAREQEVGDAHHRICECLIKRGADTNAIDDYDRSPLCLANSTIDFYRKHGKDATVPARVQTLIAQYAD